MAWRPDENQWSDIVQSDDRNRKSIKSDQECYIKDRTHFLSQVSAEMKIEMPKIGARRFKFIQNPLLLCFYAFRVTGNHVCNHLEGYFNRNSNMLLKDFNGISMGFGHDLPLSHLSVEYQLIDPPSRPSASKQRGGRSITTFGPNPRRLTKIWAFYPW